ncbi:MAG: P-type conjugative transfer ATPase TrbB [Magnetospirillum sp.]|nr:P-type conjugative transfer ATPase TrbB [Magnetospirillum sp.]
MHGNHSDHAELERIRRLDEKLRRELGPQINAWFEDPTVIEIMLNNDGSLWVERLGAKMTREGSMSASMATAMMGTLATIYKTIVNHDNPVLECTLPFDGSRFEGVLPPVASGGPAFAIRRPAIEIFTLANYVEQGILREIQYRTLRDAIANRKNIVVIGGTGSGKTTFVNACIHEVKEVTPDNRVGILEDTKEIQCISENHFRLLTTDVIDMTRLLKITMRKRPDRIIVGEVRDGAALALLKAWNTGHPGGLSTIHANSAKAGLSRLEQLVGEATPTPQPRLIAEAIDILVFIEKTPETKAGRRIKEILAVEDFDGTRYITHPV